MLHVDPKQRLSSSDVLNHAWIQNRSQLPSTSLPHQEISLIKANMGKMYNALSEQQKKLKELDPVINSQLAKRRAEKTRNKSDKSPLPV